MPRKKVVKQLQTAAEEGKKGGALYISLSPPPPRENVRLVKSGSAFVNCCNEGVYDCLIATALLLMMMMAAAMAEEAAAAATAPSLTTRQSYRNKSGTNGFGHRKCHSCRICSFHHVAHALAAHQLGNVDLQHLELKYDQVRRPRFDPI